MYIYIDLDIDIDRGMERSRGREKTVDRKDKYLFALCLIRRRLIGKGCREESSDF